MRELLFGFGLLACIQSAHAGVTYADLTAELSAGGRQVQLVPNQWGKLTDAAGTVQILATDDRGKPAALQVVTLAQSLRPKVRPSQAQIAEWTVAKYGANSGATFFVQVDGTVSAHWLMTVAPELSAAELGRRVVAARNAFATFQSDFSAPPVPAGRIATESDIDPDLKLTTADPEDMRILTHLWGWDYKGPGYFISTSHRWHLPTTVEGTTLWIFSDETCGPNGAMLLSAEFKQPAGEAEAWLKNANAGLKRGEVEPAHEGTYQYRVVVDFRGGITPKQIKADIEEFVRKTLELEKSARG